MFTSGSLRTLQYLTPFLNLQATKHCVNRSVCKKSLKMKILLSVRGFTTHTHFLHLSQLYMLSPGKQKKKTMKVNVNSNRNILIYTRLLQQNTTVSNCLPLSSSAAKKAARQSSKVTMGPQNQVGIHETTNLFRGVTQRDTIISITCSNGATGQTVSSFYD